MNHLDLQAEAGYSQRAKDLVHLQEISKELGSILNHICNGTVVAIFKVLVILTTLCLSVAACMHLQIEMAFITITLLTLCSLSAIIGAEKIILLIPSRFLSFVTFKKKT